ncbi:heavy metal translocating P-type ATPase [Bosea sp. (in: a-proteobacteria)]
MVHAIPGRARFRCLFAAGKRVDWAALRHAASLLDGVGSARVVGRIQCLVLEYDRRVTDETILRGSLLALDPVERLDERAAEANPIGAGRALAASLAVLFCAGLLPKPLRFAISLVAASPLLREAAEDLGTDGVTARVLEGLAVSMSLARGDYVVANTTNFLLSLGEYLSETTTRRSDRLLRGLLQPASERVWVLRDGREVEIDAGSVVIGDTVIVAAGAVVPVDGRALSGRASVNEAALTGESAPVPKSRGALVMSGSIVQEGRLAIYAENVGSETITARIADYVERSLAVKGQAQMESARLADRLVPTILSVAGGAWLVSGDWRRPASVLQADYSCALKLATPIAFKFAMYGAGRSGILVKGADALERLAEVDTFIFDKTGTLTTGSLEVVDAIAFDASFTPEDLICLAASIEEHYSFHPLAMAVVEAARSTTDNRHFDHQEVEFIVAHGVASVIDGKRIVVGSQHFVEDDEGIDFSEHRAVLDRLYDEGKTVLCVGFGGRLLGILALRDRLRDNAAATIRQLRSLGTKRILLLTGDRDDRAAELSMELGLDGYYAELLPEDKSRIVDELNATGARIAFVGDGINDAPALARAHVGLAMHRGADMARMTADIVLLEDDIGRVADAAMLAHEVMRVISTSFRLTIGLNTSILLAAASGMLGPLATSVLHNGSTIAILLNVLRQGAGARNPIG